MGRTTGLTHIVSLRFVEEGDTIYVISGSSRPDWMKNSLRQEEVLLHIGNRLERCRCRLLSIKELEHAKTALAAKYGSRIIQQWYSRSNSGLALFRIEASAYGPATKGEAETSMSLKEWLSSGKGYGQAVTEAFDSASLEYDFTIRSNYINSWIRERELSELSLLIKGSPKLLEIGCGTGSEAIRLAPFSRELVATDPSAKMIETIRKKIRAKKLEDKVRAVRMSASELDSLYGEEGTFDIIYSLNGALNCEPKIRDLAQILYRLIKRGGYFFCTVRNIFCASELVIHLFLMQTHKAYPRLKQPVMVSVGGMDIPATYFTNSEFISLFEQGFELVKAISLPLILPPAYLSDYYIKIPRLIRLLIERTDKLLSGLALLNLLGDQTLYVFRRK
ncbi:MAG: class I SAM-dependent methyltransferase [Thermoprotei archaeon]